MQINVRVNGLSSTIRKIDGIGRGSATTLKNASRESSRYLMSAIPAPPEPKPSYNRTGKLERGFKAGVNSISRGYAATISNKVGYAPWVISDSRVGDAGPQAWMHVGRWYTLQQVLRQSTAGVLEIYRNAYRRLLG